MRERRYADPLQSSFKGVAAEFRLSFLTVNRLMLLAGLPEDAYACGF
jgi:hypothetical protein